MKLDVLIGRQVQYGNQKILMSVTWREWTLVKHFRKTNSVQLVCNQNYLEKVRGFIVRKKLVLKLKNYIINSL